MASVPNAVGNAPNPAVHPASGVANVPSAVASFDQQFYVKQGDAVRTLGADQIRLEVASKVIRPDALICKVGDTGWRPLSDASAIGLELPSLQGIRIPSIAAPNVVPFDEPNPFARGRSGGLFSRLSQVKNKGTLIVWGLSFSLGLTIVLQRNGTFHSVAESFGLSETYESFEKSVFGGPGEGTVRSAKRLWGEVVPSELTPFTEVEARVKARGTGSP